MAEFYKQFYCPSNERYSVIIEDDEKVAYAYLLLDKSIIGDVWLYNHIRTPDNVNWGDRNKIEMPFLNPKGYIIAKKEITPILNEREVKCKWKYTNDLEEVGIYIRDNLIAVLKPRSFPGWSLVVSKDGPLAKKYKENGD